MSTILLYKQGRTGRTGRVVAKASGIIAIADPSLARPDSVVIVWGNSASVPLGYREINSHIAVLLAGSKAKALRVMAETGVRTPKFILPTELGPAIGRSSTHQQGRDIKIFGDGERLEGCDHFLEIIPSDKEFRVHCFQGKVLVTQIKVLAEGGINGCSRIKERMACPEHGYPDSEAAVPLNASFPHLPLRNYDAGWRFKRIQERPKLSKVALSACSALGLDFGAVDIIKDSRDGEYAVLEVNTAPALEGTTLERYVKAFKAVIESLN